MKGIRAGGKEGKSLKPAKTALTGQGGLWVDEDLLVKLLSDMLPQHSEHQHIAEPGHAGAFEVLPGVRAGLGDGFGFQRSMLGSGEPLEIGIGLFPVGTLAGFLLMHLAACLGVLPFLGLTGFFVSLSLGFCGESLGGGMAGFNGRNEVGTRL